MVRLSAIHQQGGPAAHGKMKFFLLRRICFALAISAAASAQQPTLARLGREADADIPRATISTSGLSRSLRSRTTSPLPDSSLARPAAQALFVRGNLERARRLAAQVLRRNPSDPEALFIRMEVAAMEDDGASLLDAAMRLCEAGQGAPADTRVQLATVRILETAGNTPVFRAAIPSIKALLGNSQEQWPRLHAALLQAAMDGVPGLDPYAISRSAGILTDWRMVGPLGKQLPGSDHGISWAGDLSAPMYQNRVVENFQFPDGQIVLPDYLSHHGTFYAASHFASLTAATWRVVVESSTGTEVYVDGQRVLRAEGSPRRHSSTFGASPGPHRVMVEFAGSSITTRVAITPANDAIRPAFPARLSLEELTYLLAAGHYVVGDFESAVKQINAIPSADNSAALQFLLAQAKTQAHDDGSDGQTGWARLHSLAPSALAADDALAERALARRDLATAVRLATEVVSAQPSDARALAILASAQVTDRHYASNDDDLWVRRLAAHPSCGTLREAVSFYRGQNNVTQANSIQRRLDGCAPESLDYAESLSAQGNHAGSAQALQRFVSAAPLHRDARLMLIRELQLAGADEAAQRAAVEWLHVAPNAGDYHRLAATVEPAGSTGKDDKQREPFYAPYRRDASRMVRQSAAQDASTGAVMMIEDHVAIARPDGSVSLYVHSLKRPRSRPVMQPREIAIPQGAQVLALRILHADGTSAALDDSDASVPRPGDAIEKEYVINYAGDGGISEHCEAFQFVFGNFGDQVLHARFVVLTPAGQADRGVVIATGGAPAMTAAVHEGMLRRIWDMEESQTNAAGPARPSTGSPIVRVVEEENGWATPSSAEHQRRIETIHPGPRPEES